MDSTGASFTASEVSSFSETAMLTTKDRDASELNRGGRPRSLNDEHLLARREIAAVRQIEALDIV
mgnify:CR=1 FL=1